jgi:hypothetical protein
VQLQIEKPAICYCFQEEKMPDDSVTPQDNQDMPTPAKQGSGLSPEGIRAMQGSADPPKTERPPEQTSSVDGTKEAAINDLAEPAYDPAKLEYRTRSPHADYQAYKDLQAADRRHELGQQAATATSLPEAVSATLAAHQEGKGDDEPVMDEYFYRKYGRAPYTEAVYPETENE